MMRKRRKHPSLQQLHPKSGRRYLYTPCPACCINCCPIKLPLLCCLACLADLIVSVKEEPVEEEEEEEEEEAVV